MRGNLQKVRAKREQKRERVWESQECELTRTAPETPCRGADQSRFCENSQATSHNVSRNHKQSLTMNPEITGNGGLLVYLRKRLAERLDRIDIP